MSEDVTPVMEFEKVIQPHSLSLAKLTHYLDTDAVQGLSSAEAQRRLDVFGPNSLPKIRGSFWRVYLAPILNGLITIYILSIVALFLLGLFFGISSAVMQAYMWAVIITFNALLAVIQQFRAQKKLEALQALAADTTIAIRDGAKHEVDTTQVVPGDLLVLAQGDRIAADGRLSEASDLQVVEASLTGESNSILKSSMKNPVPIDTPLHERNNMVFRGTFVATGSGRYIATATGQDTEIGKISQGLETLNTGDIPLRKKVNRLALFLGAGAIVLLLVSFYSRVMAAIMEHALSTPELVDNAVRAIITAMTIMPINIPLLTTIVLLTGVLVMASRGVIVRDLSAVESLGRVSVICTDKTGTLTRSEMMVSYIWDGEHFFNATGNGYAPTGKLYLIKDNPGSSNALEKEPISLSSYDRLGLLIRIGGLNNDAELVAEDASSGGQVQWRAVGDPTEAALLSLLRKSGISESALQSSYSMVQNYPFDSRLKRMTRVFAQPSGGYIAFVKGATNVLLERCTHIGDDYKAQPLTEKRAKEISKAVESFASQGYRVLSFAIRHLTEDELPKRPGPTARDTVEQNLTYVGFVCIVDPPREGVREAVKECASAGINTIMITGDALETARNIATQLAIINDSDIAIEGEKITVIDDVRFQKIRVFARVNPDDKQVIVQRHRDAGNAVAVTGDGVNDALALSISDVGIAMGITGTDVAKEASDMIIADDSFTSIVDGVRQGRGLFNKIRMMIFFYISINLAESIIFFGTFLLGINFLTYWQHIFLTITSHTWPGLALVFDRTSKYVMQEKPRDTEGIITRRLGIYLILNSFFILLGVSLIYYLTLSASLPGSYELLAFSPEAEQKARVLALTVLLFAESLMILSIRRINQSLLKSIRRESFILIYILIGFVFLMHWGLMYIPEVSIILADFGISFDFVALAQLDWLIAFMFALPTIVGMELVKWFSRRRNIFY
ncbi:MAG: cation-translocating P-type ATPase [Promethearchaeota archaeon]